MAPIQWLAAGLCFSGALFVMSVMLRHDLRRKFPFLFNYLVFYLLSLVAGLVAFFYSDKLLFHVTWVLGSLLMAMELGVIYEVLAYTLKSYSALVDLAKILFRWAALFLLLTGLITALATNGHQATKLEAALSVVGHSIRLMQCGLLLFVLVFENRLGISWRNHGMAIALGLGIYAAADLTISYVTIPWLTDSMACLISGGTYTGMLAFWGCILAMHEPASKSVLDSPSRLIFQRWNEALMATPLARKSPQPAFPVESFLPGVEQTVERVMARKMMH